MKKTQFTKSEQSNPKLDFLKSISSEGEEWKFYNHPKLEKNSVAISNLGRGYNFIDERIIKPRGEHPYLILSPYNKKENPFYKAISSLLLELWHSPEPKIDKNKKIVKIEKADKEYRKLEELLNQKVEEVAYWQDKSKSLDKQLQLLSAVAEKYKLLIFMLDSFKGEYPELYQELKKLVCF